MSTYVFNSRNFVWRAAIFTEHNTFTSGIEKYFSSSDMSNTLLRFKSDSNEERFMEDCFKSSEEETLEFLENISYVLVMVNSFRSIDAFRQLLRFAIDS